MNIDNIKNSIILSNDWNDVEELEGIKARWSSAVSKIKITNNNFKFLKIKIKNSCPFIPNRKLLIKLDDLEYKRYVFHTESNCINVKIPINDCKQISFICEDVFVPNFVNISIDKRQLGFIFSSMWITDENDKDIYLNICDLLVDDNFSHNDIFVDSSENLMSVGDLVINKSKPNIFYVGQYGTSGYATAAKGYIYKYFINGYGITWNPLCFDESTLSDDCPYNVIAKSTINKKLDYYNLRIYHSTPDLWEEFNKKYNNIKKEGTTIGYTTWETNILPKEFVNAINSQVGEVWCPSTYNQQVFQSSGVNIPIKVVPHIHLKKQLFNKNEVGICDVDGNIIKTTDDYTFYTIGEFNARKGIEDLINCFCQTFNSSDKVRLLIKTHYKGYSAKNKQYCIDSINKIISQYKNPPRIYCFLDNFTENSMLALHSIGDCYVSLTKSEGFGLTIFDAINYNKNVIVTNYGGHLDFIDKDYKGLVDYDLGYVKGMKNFSEKYSEKTLWAYPKLNHVKELMRYYHKL